MNYPVDGSTYKMLIQCRHLVLEFSIRFEGPKRSISIIMLIDCIGNDRKSKYILLNWVGTNFAQ